MAEKVSKLQKLGNNFNRQLSYVKPPTRTFDSSVMESENLIDFGSAQGEPELNLVRLRSSGSYESFLYTNSAPDYEAPIRPNMANHNPQDPGHPPVAQSPIGIIPIDVSVR